MASLLFIPAGPLLPFSSRARRRRACAPRMCEPTSASASASMSSNESQPSSSSYVPLHVHSDFSLLDGASQLPSLIARAQELSVPAIALTDHGVLYGAIQLVRTCAGTSVKPIIGNEMYVVNTDPSDSASSATGKKKGSSPKRYHLIVLAKNTIGYRNLVKLTTAAHLNGRVGVGIFARPCVNKAQLYAHREGLIVSSACLGGEVAQAILNGNVNAARDVARWYRDAFRDDYYLEIQDHGSEEDRVVNIQVLRIAKELGIKVIATNDSHFTSCLDAEAHDALICIQTGKTLLDENRLRYAGNEYFKSLDEMRNVFVDHLPAETVEEALRNTLEVAEKVEEYDLFGSTAIPDYPTPKGFKSHGDYLRHVARESMRERLRIRQASGLSEAGLEAEAKYSERLEFELDMIQRMGFASYFLVVWDYIRYAREQNIPVGPGRGSAAGSLVAFALRITDVDPIPFNLLFERFLNPERKSMPDIDTDFSVEGREKIIQYVSRRYGADRVAQIITFNRLTSKAVLKDVARVHNVPYKEADKLAKLIPVVRGKPATLTSMMSDKSPNSQFKKLIEGSEENMMWIEKARRIEGANKTYGIHAAGVVISAAPLTDSVPLSRAKHGETITQYPMEDVEALGLLKMDFLGLKNLSVIESAIKFINAGRRRKGTESDIDFSVDALPLDDAKTFKLLATGELDGIFQLDASLGMRNIVREIRPSNLEDISSILSLYRPGPLDAGLIPKFIRRKHGEEPITYDHPLLEPILKDTYGIMVYQEQIMRIARDLAGYSLGQADILRRAMGKKKVKDMVLEKPRFVSGAVQRGVPEQVAENLFEMMIQFAQYCFNKSHATAYAYLTYQTAFLKANYPVEYTAALLRANMTQSDKLVRYLSDANASGVKVLPPSVNRSELGFTVHHSADGEDVVLFGLEAVKTVGGSVGEAIISERVANGPYKSIVDLVERIDSRVLNKRSMSALVLCGAFDELHPNRKVLSEQLDSLLSLRRKLRERRRRRESKEMSEEQEQAAIEKDLKDWEEVQIALAHESEKSPDFSLLDKLAAEKETLGFYTSGHPLHDLTDFRSFLGCDTVTDIVGDSVQGDDSSVEDRNVPSLDSVSQRKSKHGEEVTVLSVVSELNIVRTAKGQTMAKWMIEDEYGRVQAIVFPSAFSVCTQKRPRAGYSLSERTENVDDVKFEKAARTEKHGEASELVHKQNAVSAQKMSVTSAVIENSQALEASDDSELTVKQDARVVVWGRVDLESSGTSKVIVDDVQRVEDVQVVLITAEHDPSLDTGVPELIVRRFIGEHLGISDFPASSYTFVNKAGEQITRQRRPKVDYSSKRRIPAVLRVLSEDGRVASFTNLGNDYRFGETSCEDIAELARKTGHLFEVVNVMELLNQSRSSAMGISLESPVRVVTGQHASENDALESGHVLTPHRKELTSPLEVKNDESLTSTVPVSVVFAGQQAIPSTEKYPSEMEGSQSESLIPESVKQLAGRDREIAQVSALSDATDEYPTEVLDGELERNVDEVDVLKQSSRPVRRSDYDFLTDKEYEEFLNVRELRSYSDEPFASSPVQASNQVLPITRTAGLVEKRVDAPPSKTPVLAFMNGDMSRSSSESIHLSDVASGLSESAVSPRSTAVESSSFPNGSSHGPSAPRNGRYSSSPLPQSFNEGSFQDLNRMVRALERKYEALASKVQSFAVLLSKADGNEKSPGPSTSDLIKASYLVLSEMDGEDEDLKVGADASGHGGIHGVYETPYNSAPDQTNSTGIIENNSQQSFYEALETKPGPGNYGKGAQPSRDAMGTWDSGSQDANLVADYLDYPAKVPRNRSKVTSQNGKVPKKHREVFFDEVRVTNEPSDILDAACLAAGKVLHEYCAVDFTVHVVAGFDFAKFVEDYTDDPGVNITAKIVLVAENRYVFVVVNVRECQPSASRKRTRLLTSGIVVLNANSEVPALEDKTVATRTARKKLFMNLNDIRGIVESLEKRSDLIKAPHSQTYIPVLEIDAAKQEFNTSIDRCQIDSGALSLNDGGQLLLWMSRAAEQCAARIHDDIMKTSVEALEVFHVPSSSDLDSDWGSANVHARVCGIAFGVVSVAVSISFVQESVTDDVTPSVVIEALFKVCCSPVTTMKQLGLMRHDSPFQQEDIKNPETVLGALSLLSKCAP